jgi:hypothetical protein
MALPFRRPIMDDTPIIAPKEREKLLKQKEERLAEMNLLLDGIEDSPFKTELQTRRDHVFAKFPTDPANLTIWIVAYYEDWLREYRKVPESYFINN